MLRFGSAWIALATALGSAVLVGDAGAEERAGRPVVVELFTSQSCYSCPPAERFLGELAGRPGVLALEFHVDYWNDLVYGGAGKWKDVFSRPEFTRRQQDYNLRIRNRAGVYTPQMVIDGRSEAVGTHESSVLAAIARAQALAEPRVSVAVGHGAAGALSVAVDGGATAGAAIWLVRFDRERTTRVLRGENHGKTLVNHNVVTGLRRIGAWRGEAVRIDLPNARPGPGEGCTVLVQSVPPGAIVGAAPCPEGGA